MRFLFYIFIGYTVFFPSQMMAQTYMETTDKDLVEEGKELNPEIISQLGIFTESTARNEHLKGNSVFLKQIGEMNQVNILTQTDASEIQVFQNGNSNKTELDYLSRTAIADLVQEGDFNTIVDRVNAPGEDISLDLQQQGNDKYFERNGVNELTKAIKFIQTDATPRLIINSYK